MMLMGMLATGQELGALACQGIAADAEAKCIRVICSGIAMAPRAGYGGPRNPRVNSHILDLLQAIDAVRREQQEICVNLESPMPLLLYRGKLRGLGVLLCSGFKIDTELWEVLILNGFAPGRNHVTTSQSFL